jgi:predicted AAA+ superfamily ATPase
MERIQRARILRDLGRKMVFLSGPRQVGKSWLAKDLSKEFNRPIYLNWDNSQDRDLILRQAWTSDRDLVVFDEIHKMPGWKGYLKGVYDTKPGGMAILVTGSARLETYRQSGDSLAGRYFQHRLFPLCPAEAAAAGEKRSLDHFLERGGFPEPFLAETDDDAKRWRRFYLDGLIREDILSFENIRELRAMNLLVELLRERVASPLSYQSLGEDTGAAPNTVKRYVEILEALYIVFRIYPHHRSIARSLLQQPKLYFFDTALVKGGPGPRLENHVALALRKELALREDEDGTPRELRYLRTKEGREADFIVSVEDSPRLAVEVKTQERDIAPGLSYFCGRYGIPGLQLVGDLRLEYEQGGVEVRCLQPWLESIESQAFPD